MKHDDKRALCPRCMRDYQAAGYIVKQDYAVTVKDECYVCGHMGWEYWITDANKDLPMR